MELIATNMWKKSVLSLKFAVASGQHRFWLSCTTRNIVPLDTNVSVSLCLLLLSVRVLHTQCRFEKVPQKEKYSCFTNERQLSSQWKHLYTCIPWFALMMKQHSFEYSGGCRYSVVNVWEPKAAKRTEALGFVQQSALFTRKKESTSAGLASGDVIIILWWWGPAGTLVPTSGPGSATFLMNFALKAET